MIAHINGKLVEKNPTFVVIECGGVGYQLNISLNTYSKLPSDENCKLYTQFVVREDAQILYGFSNSSERRLFQLLVSVSGIGPSTAMMVLSAGDANEIQEAILSGNVAWFNGVKGIGPKSAQRIILDLKDKIAKENIGSDNVLPIDNTIKEEALSALVMLGFNRSLAEKTISKILKNNPEFGVEDLIKNALKAR